MISVLIRIHNDGLFLRRVLDILRQQDMPDEVEILCCDDHSSDCCPDILDDFPEIRRIPPPEGRYIPGKTLNFLVRQARGEFIVFNNGDAIPLSREYLRRLTAPLKSGAAQAVFARQTARPDARPLVRRDYLRAFGDGTRTDCRPGFFSLVSSGFRRETLLRHPFDESFQYSEDTAWIHARGISPVYVPDAAVEHSHNYTVPELRKRFRGEGKADRQMGKKCPSLPRTVLGVLTAAIRDWIWLCRTRQWGEIPYAPVYRWIQKTAYYRGTRETC